MREKVTEAKKFFKWLKKKNYVDTNYYDEGLSQCVKGLFITGLNKEGIKFKSFCIIGYMIEYIKNHKFWEQPETPDTVAMKDEFCRIVLSDDLYESLLTMIKVLDGDE